MVIIEIIIGIIGIIVVGAIVLCAGLFIVSAIVGGIIGGIGCGLVGAISAVVIALIGVPGVDIGSIAKVSAIIGGIGGAIAMVGYLYGFITDSGRYSGTSSYSGSTSSRYRSYSPRDSYSNFPELDDPAGYVVTYTNKYGQRKIGRTKNPKRRLGELRRENRTADLEYDSIERSYDAKEDKRFREENGFY